MGDWAVLSYLPNSHFSHLPNCAFITSQSGSGKKFSFWNFGDLFDFQIHIPLNSKARFCTLARSALSWGMLVSYFPSTLRVEDFILELSVSREAWRCVQCLHRHSTFSSRSIQELYSLHRLLYGEAVSFWFFCMGEKIRVPLK